MSTIKLVSNDKREFTVNLDLAKTFSMIATMLEVADTDNLDKEIIPLPNISGDILERVLKWATYHEENPSVDPDALDEEDITGLFTNEWEDEFLNVDYNTLFAILRAANYLGVKDLLKLGCRHLANGLRGKEAWEIRADLKKKKIETKEVKSAANQDSNDDQSAACAITSHNVGATPDESDQEIDK